MVDRSVTSPRAASIEDVTAGFGVDSIAAGRGEMSSMFGVAAVLVGASRLFSRASTTLKDDEEERVALSPGPFFNRYVT